MIEGEDYKMIGSNAPTTQFGFNGGKGLIKLDTGGTWDVHFDKYDEDITLTKVPVVVKNIIFGGLYVDADGICEGVNHKTGERIEI